MKRETAEEVLAAMPRYEVHDVHVTSVTSTSAEAKVTFSVDGGELESTLASYCFKNRALTVYLASEHELDTEFLDEIESELKEAVAYQRDLSRGLN